MRHPWFPLMRLFEPIVDRSRQHQHFRTLLQPENRYVADVLNDWARGFVDRDGKFIEEFQTTFNSSFWELYIHAALKKYGMTIDFTKARPDFCIPSHCLSIEAAVASNARDAPAEHEMESADLPMDLNAFNFQTIGRMSNTLVAKHRKFLTAYGVLPHVSNRPFVIAVANFDRPYSFIPGHRAMEALLFQSYVDEEEFIAGKGGSRLAPKRLTHIFKDNGSRLDLGMFLTPEYKEISAVLYSTCANFGKARALALDPLTTSVFTALRWNSTSVHSHLVRLPKSLYEESLLDGLRVYHNPHALHPVDPALFRNPKVYQSYVEDDDWKYEARDGLLLFRSVSTIQKVERSRAF